MTSRLSRFALITAALLLGASHTPVAALSRAQTQVGASSDVPPVVVVLDLSGSMNDDDGAGLIKLTGAKKAVDDVIRSLPSTQPFGLWTFPGGSDDCSSGSFAIPPSRVTDLNGTIAKVDSLTADGGTPTGPALQSAADTLTSSGTKGATLVLVSDGESNCGDNPCDVAKHLVANGIKVTIHTTGFRVSPAGRAELNCVASATGGTYMDVGNSAELNRTLLSLTRAKLRLQVAPSNRASTALGLVTVDVANPSAVAASDVHIQLTPTGGAPTNFNMQLRVGNLPPGTSVQRSWSFGAVVDSRARPLTTTRDSPRVRGFTVSAWAKNADRVSAAGTVDGPSSASAPVDLRNSLGSWLRKPLDSGHPIAILGDSYSAGEGTFDYVTPPKGISPACHRSAKTYLVPSLRPGDVVNLACSGAVSWDFYYPGRDGTTPQLTQLAEMKRPPGAVVMTLGGNDIGFADIVKQCVLHSCDSDAAKIAAWDESVDSLRPWLGPLYQDVWKTINVPQRRQERGGSYAPVLVLAYPQVTHATKYGACGSALVVKSTLGAGEVRVANNLQARLNATIRAAVADARDAGYEIYFVGSTADAMLPDHTLCDGDSAYVNDVVGLGAVESVHPNVSGYAAETGAIIGWSATTVPEGPDTSAAGPKAAPVAKVPWALLPFGTPDVTLSGQDTIDGALLQGSPVSIHGSGYLPGTPVIVTIHSTPAVLGTLVADGRGRIHGELHLPPQLALGKHEIVAYGTRADGSPLQDRINTKLGARPPTWVSLALIAAMALLLTSVVIGGTSLRQRH